MRGYVVYSGKSAYEIAVDNGFTGSEKEWLESLKGAPGKNGENGQDGMQGLPGLNGLPWIHTPFEYGAVGDGVTDDTDAFNDAVQHHDHVYVPSGRYRINGHKSIILRDNIVFEMADDACLLLYGESPELEATTGYKCFTIKGCQNIVIKGGKILGDRFSGPAFNEKGCAIGMSTDIENDNRPYRNITIDGVYIDGIKGDGIIGWGEVKSSTANLKEVFDSHSPKNIVIKNTTVTRCYRHGTFISSGDGITFQNCRYINNGAKKEDYLDYVNTLNSEEELFHFMGGNSSARGLLYQMMQYKSTNPFKSITVRLSTVDGNKVKNQNDYEKVLIAEKVWKITSWNTQEGEGSIIYTPEEYDPSVKYSMSGSHFVFNSGITKKQVIDMLNAWNRLSYGSSLDMERHMQYESMHNLVLDNFYSSGSALGVQLSPGYNTSAHEQYKDYGYDRYSLITSLTLNNCEIMDRVVAGAATNIVNGGTLAYIVTGSAKTLDIKKAIIHRFLVAGSGRPYTKEINIEDSSVYPIDTSVVFSCEGGSDSYGEYAKLNINRCTLSTFKSDTRPEDMKPDGGLRYLNLFATQNKIHSINISDSVININCPTGVYLSTQPDGNISLNRCTVNFNYKVDGRMRTLFTCGNAGNWSISNCIINTDNAQYTEKDTNWGAVEMVSGATASLIGNIYNGNAFENLIRAYAATNKTIIAANNVLPNMKRICYNTGPAVSLRDVGNVLLS